MSTIITNINEMELHQLQMLKFELQEMRKTMEKGTGIYRVCTAIHMALYAVLEGCGPYCRQRGIASQSTA